MALKMCEIYIPGILGSLISSSMKVVHSWLKEYMGDTLPEAKKVEELLTFHAFEVEDSEVVVGEEVIEVKVLPDRSSDCLSHRGIARELGSILGVALEKDPLRTRVDLPSTEVVEISIEDSLACSRFTAAVITGVTVQKPPAWLQQRLAALGQRSVNNIVDATNYVMFALGQPMHAYDADKFPQVDGKWQFGVRLAKAGETVSLLAEGGKSEDRVVELIGTELLIVDGSSDTPVGLAGIKGGRFAELTADTKNIILEAASFNPTVIRKTARRLGILTDASKRFENAPARELPLYAQQLIVELILDIAGGSFEGVADVYLERQTPSEVVVSVAHVNRLLGLSLAAAEVQQLIERVGATVTEKSEGVFMVVSPWERTDLTLEVDYIAEVGRLHGLSDITSVVPATVPLAAVNARQYYSDQIRAALMDKGFSEVITTSFQKKGDLQLLNSLASDKSCLRESLRKNITGVLDANFAHCDLLGVSDVRVFEIGTVFEKVEGGVGEYTALALGARTKGNGYHSKDDQVLEEGMEIVEKTLGTKLSWHSEKGVAELNLAAALETLPTPSAYETYVRRESMTYQRVSQYPAISRDIALFVVGGEAAAEVIAKLVAAAGPLLVRHALFDTFSKEGRTSYAFRLVFQATDRTLTNEEVDIIMGDLNTVAKNNGWEVR
jgi:phenylalanyl-tRNA synthetase beta chain